MKDLDILASGGDTVRLDGATLVGFAARLRGPLVTQSGEGYDEARSLWNAMIDRRPALVVRAGGAADVVDAVRFAREHDLLTSVRGGGHNIAGTAVCDGGLLIDLSRQKGVHVDRAAGRVRVQSGCAWGDVDRETQAFGQAVPSGIVSTTGVAGLTLGGGFGWLSRRFGFTCDNLVSAEVATAEGMLVHASAESEPELFWALRGGGGNFGIVTSFVFALRPLGPQVMAGLLVHPMAQAREVADFFFDFTARAPDELTLLLILRIAPPAPFLPPHVHGQPIAAIAVCHAGPLAEGESAVRPLRAFGEPLVDLVAPKPFVAHQTLLDVAQPPGRQYYWKSVYLDGGAAGLSEVLVAQARAITSPQSSILVMQQGGAASRVAPDASAAGHREAAHIVNIAGSWLDPAESEHHAAWVRETWRAVQPFGAGGYVNFLTRDAAAHELRDAYGATLFDRLRQAKARYDPTNFFRSNQNIPPADASG